MTRLCVKKPVFVLVMLLAGLVTTCTPGVHPEQCDGVIVDGICEPANCDNRECPQGFICDDATNLCVEIDCLRIECEPGMSCANGVCYPDNCETRTCPGLGDVCVDEECQAASCVGVECPAGERCAAGVCYPVDCETKVCPGYAEVCIDDECVERTCVGVTCPAGERCAGGICYPEGCSIDTPCFGEGEVCIDGVCQRSGCVDVECEQGYSCANGWCYPDDCPTKECSDYGEVCFEDNCVDADCVGVQCPIGEACARGDCFPIDCGGFTCNPPYVCYNNECVRHNCVGMQCPPGQVCADGECFDFDCSTEGCGFDEVCLNGQCVPDDCVHVQCPPGEVCAVDLNCYPEDCGGQICSEYEVCDGGVCVDQLCFGVNCTLPEICVAGECYNPDCATPCGPDEICENDVCIPIECANGRCCPPIDCTNAIQCVAYDCDEGVTYTCSFDGDVPVWSDSSNACTDLDPCTINDVCSAGVCAGVDMPCDPFEICVDGVCRCGGTGPDCINNETCCTTECFDLDVDIDHCGDCTTLCRRDNATPQCVGGICSIGTCDALWDDCNATDADGCETSLETLTDCATCGTTCSAVGATVSCAGGVCHITNCDPLMGDCDGDVGTGCEASLETLTHCNACDTPCARDNASAVCPGGNCQIDTCNALFDDCNGQDPDGCEISLETLTDCGTCGTPCSRTNATAICTGGTCLIDTCNALWDDCDTIDANGCETSLETLIDCGTCTTACDRVNATPACNGGACHIDTCDSLWGDCDTNDPTGCEEALTSLTHCGACAVACALDHSSEDCTTGICLIVACDALWDDCNSQDPDGCETSLETLTDCGSCSTPCGLPHAISDCTGGNCTVGGCDSLWDDCNLIPADGCETSLETLTDCGACTIPCSRANATADCSGGSCHIGFCDALWGDCDFNDPNGCELPINTLTDCGGCGVNCSLAHATAECSTGVCLVDTCTGFWDDCDGQPANGCETSLETLTDCGSCSTTCTRAHASALCPGGNCQIDSCIGLWDDCNSNDPDGCETSLETLSDCGVCNTPCSRAHATANCGGGSCHIGSCDALWGDCDSNDPNGCEEDLTTLSDCGGCGATCSLVHANETCATGQCRIQSCVGLWDNCDGTQSNGCETPLDTLTDCGSCSTPCSLAHANQSCAGGTCQITSCIGLWDDCNSQDPDGCETSLETLGDCGACNTPCSRAHATANCGGGSCHIGSCDSLWDDCDSNDPNGCETSLTTLSDCGGCGVSCSLAHANETCATGQCRVSSCIGLWGNCDGTHSNGCEQTLDTLVHCAGCNVPCSRAHASATCAGGVCQISSCIGLWGNCNGTDSDGCEASLESLTHCSTCNTPCSRSHATASCVGGSCHIGSCDSLWGDCDSNDPNGCETALNTLSNCGGCGVGCALAHANETCAGGSCLVQSCDALWGNCDGNHANGCEQTLTTLTHCSGCNVPCSLAHASETCASGTCLLVSCDANWYDIDNNDVTGCECGDTDGTNDSCNVSSSVGTVSGSQSVVRNGTIFHRTGYQTDQDCFVVTHATTNPANGDGGLNITLSGTNLSFDAWKGGCGSLICSNDTSLSTVCSSVGGICQTDNDGVYYVCVRAANGQNNVCSTYTLTFQATPDF
ncbi:MAG: hypothetical protein JRJ87_16915 [Deltaproteobacteria bacterium]|nr:hypothetical protein [Deltaproteobacteria bacterium]